MHLKLAILCLTLSASCMAQEIPVIAMSAEDAATCATGCQMITKEAFQAITERLKRAEELEAIAQQLAAEAKRKPTKQYCT